MDSYLKYGFSATGRRNAYRNEFSYHANCYEPSGFPFSANSQEMRERNASCYIEMDELLKSTGSTNDDG